MTKKVNKKAPDSEYTVKYTCPIKGVLRECGDKVKLSQSEAKQLIAEGKVSK